MSALDREIERLLAENGELKETVRANQHAADREYKRRLEAEAELDRVRRRSTFATPDGKTFTVCTLAASAVLDEAYSIPDAVLQAPITHAEKLFPLCDAIQRWRREDEPRPPRCPECHVAKPLHKMDCSIGRRG